MSVAQATVISRVRALLGAQVDWEAYTTGSVASGSTTTIPVNDGTDWGEGDVGEFSDGDLFLVQSVSSNNLTVKRSHLGSTGAAQASGAVILKNPDFYIKDIKDAINATINSVWPYAWTSTATTITPSSTTVWYNLAADVVDLVTVVQVYSTYSLQYYGDKAGYYPIIMNKNIPASLCASGVGIAFPNGFANPTGDVNITYRRKLVSTLSGSNYTDLSDDHTAECISFGAAARLSMAKLGPKALLEDVAEGERNVDPGDRLTLANFLQAKHTMLLNNWTDELRRSIPPMGTVR